VVIDFLNGKEVPITAVFEKPGSLPKPGRIGRTIRIVSGCVLLYFFIETITGFGNYIGLAVPKHPSMWLGVALSFYFLAYVVNVGFTITWGRRLQLILVAAAMVTVVLDLLIYRSFWGPPLGLLLFILLSYVTGHLGASFILAGILATPG
jgi:hypothetical protein